MDCSDSNRPDEDRRCGTAACGAGLSQSSDDRESLSWRKSSKSANNGYCVEVARLGGGQVAVRDSKDVRGPVLSFSPAAWHSFVSAVRHS